MLMRLRGKAIAHIKGVLQGTEYPNNVSAEDEIYAEYHGIVIVCGESDDIMAFYGAIREEFGCYGGGTAYITKEGLITPSSCDCEYAKKWFDQQKETAKKITGVWCEDKQDNAPVISWTYETEIPHETFEVMEDGDIYCVGIIFALSDL